MNERLQKSLFTALIASEASHILCCVLPTLFSVLSLLAGLGIIASVPGVLMEAHDAMHRWEIPIIAFSGLLLALGWGILAYDRQNACCHHSGCSHGSCAPRMRRARWILIAATILFTINLTVYFSAHKTDTVQTLIHEHLHVDPAAADIQ